MRFSTIVAAACCVVLSLASCGGDNKNTTPNATVHVNASTTVPASSTPSSSTSVTDVFPTEPLPCQSVPVPTTPVTSPAPSGPVLLTNVQRKGDACVDHVIFTFTSKTSEPPGYSITYAKAPFAEVASGKVVTVKGSAFIVVKVSPGYGYDFEHGKATYTGERHITPAGANHVEEIVETGDFEGVLTWVIGLDSKRAFTVQATGSPQTELVVTVA